MQGILPRCGTARSPSGSFRRRWRVWWVHLKEESGTVLISREIGSRGVLLPLYKAAEQLLESFLGLQKVYGPSFDGVSNSGLGGFSGLME